MPVVLRPVTIATETDDGDGRLVFDEDRLIAVISRLGDLHEALAGQWYVEAGFLERMPYTCPTFATLESFCAWMGDILLSAMPPED